MTWGFAGKHYDRKSALALCYARGFHGSKRLITAVAVMTAESQRWDGAWHENMADDGVTVLSTDRGLFQINDMAHPQWAVEDMFDPRLNTDMAFRLSQGGDDFTPWAAYNSGNYLKYVPEITATWVLGRWRSRVARWLD